MAHVAKVVFSRGEVTPLAHARPDLELYKAGAAKLKNWHVLKEGGITRRSGTKYIGALKDADKDVRLVDFVFSTTQAYCLEMGDGYTRFWTQGGQVLSGMSPYEIVSPFAEAELRNISWLQSFDVMYFCSQSYTRKPQKLSRIANTNWTWADVDFWDGPYLPINEEATTATCSTAPITGSNPTVTFSLTTGINGGAGLQSTDVGRHFRIQTNGVWSWGKITAVSTTKICTVHVYEAGASPNTTASTSWRLGAFSDTTGYPGYIAWYQSRIFYGGTPSDPRGIWFSRSGFPEDMTPSDYDGTVADDHGGYVSLLGKGDAIQWLQEGPRVQVGTTGAIRTVGASNSSTAFGPRNVSQQVEVVGGVSDVAPVVVDVSTLHTPRFSRAIEDMAYDYNTNSYATPRISNLSEHLFDSGIVELWHQKEPSGHLWCVLGDGTLSSTTLDKYEKVVGFTPQDVSGEVFSACAIPGTSQDDLYLAVRREIDGEQVQYMEFLQPRFRRMDKEDAWYVDCGGQYSGAPTNTVSGVTWLPNTEVAILADGIVIANQTVSETGVLTLPGGRTASKITFGLPIECTGQLLEPPIDAPDGSSKGRKMRVVDCIATVYETLGLKFTSDRGRDEVLSFRDVTTLMSNGSALITGSRKSPIDGSWDSRGVISFKMDDPLPCTILALNVGLDYEP